MNPGSTEATTLDALRACLRSLFPRASDSSVARLIETSRSRTVGAGLIEDPTGSDQEILLVLEGHVAVIQHAPDGRLALLGLVESGGILGLLTMDGDPGLIGLEALDTVVLATWPTPVLRDIAEEDPGMSLDVVDLLLQRLRVAISLLEKRTFATASARLASALLQHENLVFTVASPRIPRSQLSALAGVSREMTGRILRRWERAGIVSRAGPDLQLVDRRRLEEEATGADSLASAPRPASSIAS